MGQKLLYPIVEGKKQCGDCGEWLELSDFSKYRDKYYSSRCRACVREYGRKYRDDLENKEKIKKYQKERMTIQDNRDKKNEYSRQYRKNDYVKNKMNETLSKWLEVEKQKAVDYKGGRCSSCGYENCLSALEFHHINPSEKELYNSHWTFERNKNELDKCILLCANCHREKHEEMRKNEKA
ncbi:hypothetical protein SDC9_130894 [bioreactor metagenome]|uniref:HNH domain-containing protein n=1 Tax=bioreactor metagenome TaxID=1076179 RepID=A0A645D3R5_9ZZZZ